jgi:hypothetical protein
MRKALTPPHDGRAAGGREASSGPESGRLAFVDRVGRLSVQTGGTNDDGLEGR